MRGRPGRAGGVAALIEPDPAPGDEDVIDYEDFTRVSGAAWGEYFNTSRSGRGRDLTRYVLTASTAAGLVPSSGTNQLFGQHPGALSAGATINSMTLEAYTVDMSDVPHNCHGIQARYVKNLTVRNMRIRGVRGSSSTPPGETFSLSVAHCGEAGGTVRIDNLILDGTTRAGTKVAATLLGFNDAYNSIVNGLVATGSAVGFGAALWQCGGTHVFNQPDFRDNRRAINHEQMRAGSVFTYNQPDCRDQTGPGDGRPHVTFNSNFTFSGSNYPRLIINEPVWDRATGPFRVGVSSGSYFGLPQRARPQDVTLIIDGVTKTGPVLDSKFAIGDVW